MSRVRTCVVVAEERPRIPLTQSFSKLFKDLGLHPRAVSTSFGCRVNLAVCLQVGRINRLILSWLGSVQFSLLLCLDSWWFFSVDSDRMNLIRLVLVESHILGQCLSPLLFVSTFPLDFGLVSFKASEHFPLPLISAKVKPHLILGFLSFLHFLLPVAPQAGETCRPGTVPSVTPAHGLSASHSFLSFL